MTVLLLVLLLVLIGIAAVLGIEGLRLRFVSGPALSYIRRVMPPISDTEREAIEAGTVWWEAELFRGNPDWRKLLSVPLPQLTEEEQAFLDGPVEQLCALLDEWDVREHKDLPPEAWALIKRERFFGLIIPTRYGGREFSTLAHSQVVMKIASRNGSAGVVVMVPNSLGPAELLLHYGTDAQRKHYLPRLARGDEIPCFALTAPTAGSDAGSIPDTGIVCRRQFEGQETLGLLLNWNKRYITLAPRATLLGLAFKTLDPDHLLGERTDLGISCALIPVKTAGVEIGQRHYPVDMSFPNGPTRGSDVFIPLEWVIGGRAGVGRGWRMLMESLSVGRGISLPALATAHAKLCTATGGAYARVRRQFRLPIGRFEGVEEALARIAGYTFLIDAARLLVAGGIDAGEKPAVATALLKYQTTELARKAVNHAMDVHGGRAVCDGSSNYLLRPYCSLPMLITVEGANILTRTLIVFGQGALRCHPYLLSEVAAASERGGDALRKFDRAFTGHLAHVLGNLGRSLVLAVMPSFAPAPISGAMAPYYRRLTWASSAFAALADFALLVLGGALKRKEKLSGRFADALGAMFLCSAVLKRHHELGAPAELEAVVRWSADYCLAEIDQAFHDILRNFPSRVLRVLLKRMIFPWGRRHGTPLDDLGHEVAQRIQEPGAVRERLIEGIYRSSSHDDPVGRIEHALLTTLEAEPIEAKLKERGLVAPGPAEFAAWLEHVVGLGHLPADQARVLREAEEARMKAINVDEFSG